MEPRLIHLLLISGFLSVSECSSRDYVLIQELKTWNEAQAYCRQNHADLAIVQSEQDREKIKKISPNKALLLWIGLYDDVNSWRWSFNNENVMFTRWDFIQPDNVGGNQVCGSLRPNGNWHDLNCKNQCVFLCQTGGQPELVSQKTSWFVAQNYCREHYEDLFTVKTNEENQQLTSMIQDYSCAWIGLFRDSWMWSDKTTVNASSLKWLSGQPDNFLGDENCAAVDFLGMMSDTSCSELLFFACNKIPSVPPGYVKRQILRLEVKAGDNVTEQDIKSVMLKEIKQRLGEKGMSEDFKLAWRVQSNGLVFQKIQNGSSEMTEEL
ncbi:C-type mannose receptor 2-like [Xyrauchen texanus]|uniref:C-type mannose receptor 2-like n=1 Tax=Xyrauchen texanus TaxID=154827 RepID=UPI0022421F7A|nr:C-type mannose receptor 2-like [Xyrauchen texanus]